MPLTENRVNRVAGIKLLSDGYERNIQAVNRDGLKFFLAGSFHHFLKSGRFRFPRESLDFINCHIFGGLIAVVGANIFFAQLNLIANTFAFSVHS